MKSEDLRLTAAGASLEARLLRSTHGPTLIFLHEGLGSLSAWRDFPERVHARVGGAALVYSRRGYGRSDPAPLPRRPDFMHQEASVLGEILDAVSGPKVLVGHSDGGTIALLHAARHPPRDVRAVVAIAPHVFVEDVTVRQLVTTRREYVEGELRARLARHHDDVDQTFHGWMDIWLSPAFRDWNIERDIDGFSLPLVLVQGLQDENGTLAQLDAIAARVRGPQRRVLLDACGHQAHRAQPEGVITAIAEAVRDFA